MGDRKFNTNDQQVRAEALTLANSNAVTGTPPELIIAEADKFVEYITEGLRQGTELEGIITRVKAVRQLQYEQQTARKELELKKESVELEAEAAKFVEEHPDEEIIAVVEATPEGIEKLRDEAIAAAEEIEAVNEGSPEETFAASVDDALAGLEEEVG